MREVARLFRLLVKPTKPDGFCHMPNVWLRKPEMCSPLSQPCSLVPPVDASGKSEFEGAVVGSTETDAADTGRTEVVDPVTLRVSPEVAVRSAAIANELSEKINAKTKARLVSRVMNKFAAFLITDRQRVLNPISSPVE